MLLFHWTVYFPISNTSLAQWHWPAWPLLNPTVPLALEFEWVYLFFVLSGFLLTIQTQDQVIRARAVGVIYVRRLLWIFPAVWLQLMVLALVGGL